MYIQGFLMLLVWKLISPTWHIESEMTLNCYILNRPYRARHEVRLTPRGQNKRSQWRLPRLTGRNNSPRSRRARSMGSRPRYLSCIWLSPKWLWSYNKRQDTYPRRRRATGSTFLHIIWLSTHLRRQKICSDWEVVELLLFSVQLGQ